MPKLMPTLIISGGAVFNAVDRIRIHSPRNQVRKILLRIIPIQPPKRSSTPNTNKVMKRKPKTISKEKAIVIASNHNHIPNPNRKGIHRIRTKGSIKASEPKARLLIQPPPKTRINTNIQIYIYLYNIH